MSIQSNINQSISLMGMMFRFSPEGEKAVEEARQSVAEKKAKERAETAEIRYRTLQQHAAEGISARTTKAEKAAELDLYKETVEAGKERYLASPSDETYEDYMTDVQGYAEASESAQMAEQKAQDALAAEQRRYELYRKITEGVSPSYNVREVMKYGKE